MSNTLADGISSLDLYSAIIGSIGGIVVIVGGVYRLLDWLGLRNPWDMKFTLEDIHKPKGRIKWSESLKLPVAESTTVKVRIGVRRSTRFYEITVRPVVRNCRIHWLGFRQWQDVDADCPLSVITISDETRQSKARRIYLNYSKDDRCGTIGIYENMEDMPQEFTVAAGSHINLELRLKAIKQWQGYIEFSNTPFEGQRRYIRRIVTIE